MAKRNKGDIQFPPPREKCKHCRNWMTQEDVGFNDYPHCCEGRCYEADRYANRMADDCPKYLED